MSDKRMVGGPWNPWTQTECGCHDAVRHHRARHLLGAGLSVEEVRELLTEQGVGAPACLPSGDGVPPGYQIEAPGERRQLPPADDAAARWLHEHGEADNDDGAE